MNDDSISRDAVLDACSQSINILDAMSRIEDLPSVTPKQSENTMMDAAIDEWRGEMENAIKRALEKQIEVLDKIRAELHATAEMHADGDYYLRDGWIDEIFDKYRVESEGES